MSAISSSAARRSTASESTLAIAVRKAVSSWVKWSGRPEKAPRTPNGRVGPAIMTTATLRVPARRSPGEISMSGSSRRSRDRTGSRRVSAGSTMPPAQDRDDLPTRAAQARERAHLRPLAAGQDLEDADAVDPELVADGVGRALQQRVDVEVLERLLAELGHRALALLGAGELRDVLDEALEPDGLTCVVVDDVAAGLEHAQVAIGVPHRTSGARTGARWRATPSRSSRMASSSPGVGQLELEDRAAAGRRAPGRGP